MASLGTHPSYSISTSVSVSVTNVDNNTARITFSYTSTVGTYTSVLSSGVKVKTVCNGTTKGPTAIVGCRNSGDWDDAGTYTQSHSFDITRTSSSQSISYTAYALTQVDAEIGHYSASATVDAKPIENYSHTVNHYYIGFNGETGTLADWPNHYTLATTTVTIKQGDSIKYSDYATTIPNGSELRSVNSGNGSGLSPAASYTQGTGSESWNFYYYPFNYNITYDLIGGEITGTNPSSYNVLYGKSIDYKPIKQGHNFLGWEVKSSPVTWTPGGTSNWSYVRIFNNIEPGVTYNVNMDSATVTSGSASQFTSLIYDFTSSAVLASAVISFGSNISYSLTCPKNADPTHELVLLVYSAISGSTANIYSKLTNVSVSYFSPIATYSFDFTNTNFVKYAAINSSTGEYVAGNTNYTTTPDLIPIEGGTVLYSNMIVCGVYTYDADGNFIKRESSYTKVHPISSNAAYIRIEIAINTTSYETYAANFTLTNEMGINKGLEAEFSSTSVCYSELAKRTTSDLYLTAIWDFIPYTIAFDANGGSGDVPKNIKVTSADGITISNEKPVSAGRRAFVCWNTSSDGSGESFYPESLCSVQTDKSFVVLYAMYSNNDIYLNSDGSVECLDFIEDVNCTFPTFQKDGTIMAGRFIEHTSGIIFSNGIFYANSFIKAERPLLSGITQGIATLADVNGNIIVDSNGYILVSKL